jgi:hypothetical protein
MAVHLVNGTATAARQRIAELETQLEAEKAILEMEATPAEPLEANAVIRFRKYRGTYSFAAIKGGSGDSRNLWFATQDASRSTRPGQPPRTWGQLLYWIGSHNWHQIEVMS